MLKDTRALQKDINFLSGKLERTFTETDELIFKVDFLDKFYNYFPSHVFTPSPFKAIISYCVFTTGYPLQQFNQNSVIQTWNSTKDQISFSLPFLLALKTTIVFGLDSAIRVLQVFSLTR